MNIHCKWKIGLQDYTEIHTMQSYILAPHGSHISQSPQKTLEERKNMII